jgi:hypothetical protein
MMSLCVSCLIQNKSVQREIRGWLEDWSYLIRTEAVAIRVPTPSRTTIENGEG